MVSSTRYRPLWIVKIHKRLSIQEFKKQAKQLKNDAEICWVLKGPETQTAYEVTVETMENCGMEESFQKIWVTEEMARATGEMLDNFEESENSLDADSSFSDSDEKDYEKLNDSEKSNPYQSDSDDGEDENSWNFDDLEEPEKNGDAGCKA